MPKESGKCYAHLKNHMKTIGKSYQNWSESKDLPGCLPETPWFASVYLPGCGVFDALRKLNFSNVQKWAEPPSKFPSRGFERTSYIYIYIYIIYYILCIIYYILYIIYYIVYIIYYIWYIIYYNSMLNITQYTIYLYSIYIFIHYLHIHIFIIYIYNIYIYII